MKVIKGGVLAAKGFRGMALSCGIKRSGKPDLALIIADESVPTAAVFTQSSVKAAPVVVTQEHLGDCFSQAIIVNSGNANCFTGEFGLQYANRMAECVSEWIAVEKNDVIVSSTGIIGKQLPIKKIEEAVPKLVKGLARTKEKQIAKAIMTTDTKIKECAVKVKLGGKEVTIGACAKGSGMIEPNMATMLCFITTDADIDVKLLNEALKKAVMETFNCISVDGCMSTNDMVTIMASGQAGNPQIKTRNKDFTDFCEALEHVCLDLAKKIVLDGEGATKFITINVTGATHRDEARIVAKHIANSPLVKTAAFASDQNWGRVVAAVGAAGTKASEKTIKVKFSSFKKKDIAIDVDLGLGKASGTVYTCDLSYEYVKINGEYN